MVTSAIRNRAIPLLAAVAFSGAAAFQAPKPAPSPAQGVRCPAEFTAVWDTASKVLKCRREVVSWVVTACPEKEFGTYVVKHGADACEPTEIPGVGKPPGSRGSKTVSCAAAGYRLLTDRTGDRDRCEKTETLFAIPLPAR